MDCYWVKAAADAECARLTSLNHDHDLVYEVIESQGAWQLRERFRWELPADFNLGATVVDRHPADAPAILVSDGRTVTRTVTFGELRDRSARFANVLRAFGVSSGERVAILLTQRPETPVAHIAIAKLGAIAVPLSTMFGPEALEMRLRDADVCVVLGETDALERVSALGVEARLIDVDRELDGLLAAASPVFETVATTPDTPALITYTSGTTGPPKGALHGHRVLPGHLPGFELSHDFFPQPGDVTWTPADWAWIGGLYDILMPSLYHGRPVVAFRSPKFDPEQALDVIAHAGVRNVFMPATALRLIRRAGGGRRVALRTLASGGETVGEETAAWCEEVLGVRLSEFYGQTEANVLVGNCAAWPAKPGAMGLPYPGHDVRLVDGEICVRVADDPVVFLGYWRDEAATAEKVREGWLRTGDLATADEDGYLRFLGRADDVISSGGYRIGPGEVEDCLIRHPSVALAAVIGAPDPERGEIVKAFVVLAPGVTPSDALAIELQAFVASRLAAYEYPRALVFVDSLPTTVTGKIRRGELRRLELAQTVAESRGELGGID